jgi:formylglycine-generating enzyme required for sulfatase activity
VRNRFAVSSRPIARGSCIGFIALILLCIHAAPAVVRSRINSRINARTNAKVNAHDQLTYVWISPGSYLTGCQPDDQECIGWERPRQKITIEQGFWIGQTEVTQAAYQRIMNSNPSRYQGPQRPAEQIDWYSATNYCKRVGMRLPTESEWEYAALGNVQAPRYGEINKIAWYDGNSGDMTHDVAQKQPNSYGLFDMLGNVWEWVEDVCTCDPKRRLMKGGSFYNISRDLRVPNRETPLDTLQHRNIGFRCVANSLP